MKAISPHRVITERGNRARRRRRESHRGVHAELKGLRRSVVPVYSLMVATEPLDAEFWASAGLERRQTFSDMRHLVIYGQRTADDRIAFGGRGAPYHFGSAIEPALRPRRQRSRSDPEHPRRPFPALEHSEITHAWGGPLGITRDWHPSVGLDRSRAVSRGPVATQATGCRPPTSRVARSPT